MQAIVGNTGHNVPRKIQQIFRLGSEAYSPGARLIIAVAFAMGAAVDLWKAGEWLLPWLQERLSRPPHRRTEKGLHVLRQIEFAPRFGLQKVS